MCYSPAMSMSFALLGVAALIYVQDSKKAYLSFLILFYIGMEILQSIQTYLLDDCENRWNYLLTEVAYLFLIVQPFIWNFYFYHNSSLSESGLFKAGIGLSIAWMVFSLLGRLLYGTIKPMTKDDSIFTGDNVCTYRGVSHLYWEWTSANFKDFNPTYLMYFLVWFIPALLSTSHRITGIIIAMSALLSAGISAYMGNINEFTTTWCYISIPIMAFIVFIEK
jgi:hypothetical protein